MQGIGVKLTSGKTGYIAEASQSEVMDGTLGLCLGCGEEAYGVEPDARQYACEVCGEARVYGLQELLLMGRLRLAEDEEE